MVDRQNQRLVTEVQVSPAWELRELRPLPEEEWQRLIEFLGLGKEDRAAMVQTVEPLFRRGHELVVANYDYLQRNPETAAILGWESGVDEEHLSERRRFFTLWLLRVLGMDLSPDFARYLFRAGQTHAGHGPRKIHVPAVYVTGSISLMTASFARVLAEEMPGKEVVPAALAGWNKIFSLHLHMMLYGYTAAQEWDSGAFDVRVGLFGRMRQLIGEAEVTAHASPGDDLGRLMGKFFDYYPQARALALSTEWEASERPDARGNPWMTAIPVYRPKAGWRVLLNGRDSTYLTAGEIQIHPGDEVQVFPPGR